MIAPRRRTWCALAHDRSGLALLEFALGLPLILAVGAWGIELSNLALTNLRVSQFALNLADTAARVGQDQGSVTQLREADIDDALQGIRVSSAAFGLTTKGRVTLSSLEYVQQSYDTQRVQRIHWQRCMGLGKGPGYDTAYPGVKPTDGTGTTQDTAGLAMPNGMGDGATNKVMAPNDSGVMFVEVSYPYQPLFGSVYVKPQIVRYTASFLVRDNRLWVNVTNPDPAATVSSCDKYTI